MNLSRIFILAILGSVTSAYAECPNRVIVCKNGDIVESGRRMSSFLGGLYHGAKSMLFGNTEMNPQVGLGKDGCEDIPLNYLGAVSFCEEEGRGGVLESWIEPVTFSAEHITEFSKKIADVKNAAQKLKDTVGFGVSQELNPEIELESFSDT